MDDQYFSDEGFEEFKRMIDEIEDEPKEEDSIYNSNGEPLAIDIVD